MCRALFVSTSQKEYIPSTMSIIGSFWSHLLRGLLVSLWSNFTTLCQDPFSPMISHFALLHLALREQDRVFSQKQWFSLVESWRM